MRLPFGCSIAAARGDYEALQATFQSVRLALQADVAQIYFALREADEELALLRDTVKLREESVQLLQRRFDLGEISELDPARSRTELQTARSEAIELERLRAAAWRRRTRASALPKRRSFRC